MARLHPQQCPGDWDWHEGEPFDVYDKRTKVLYDLVQTASDKIGPNDADLTGFIVDFPIADGRAVYRVMKMKPLTLQHIPIGDGYAIPAAHLRGLTVADVRQQIRRRRNPLFGAKR